MSSRSFISSTCVISVTNLFCQCRVSEPYCLHISSHCTISSNYEESVHHLTCQCQVSPLSLPLHVMSVTNLFCQCPFSAPYCLHISSHCTISSNYEESVHHLTWQCHVSPLSLPPHVMSVTNLFCNCPVSAPYCLHMSSQCTLSSYYEESVHHLIRSHPVSKPSPLPMSINHTMSSTFVQVYTASPAHWLCRFKGRHSCKDILSGNTLILEHGLLWNLWKQDAKWWKSFPYWVIIDIATQNLLKKPLKYISLYCNVQFGDQWLHRATKCCTNSPTPPQNSALYN